MNNLEFIDSSRGGKLLLYDNYLYRIHLRTKEKTYWKCASDNSCKVRVILCQEKLEKISGLHTHEPDNGKLIRKRFYNQVKSRSKAEPTIPVPKIYKEELANFAPTIEVASNLPGMKTAEKTMYKARSTARSSLPDSLKEINVSNLMDKTEEVKESPPIDDGKEKNRIEVHFTEDQFENHRADNRRFLKQTAVPSLFNPPPPSKHDFDIIYPSQNEDMILPDVEKRISSTALVMPALNSGWPKRPGSPETYPTLKMIKQEAPDESNSASDYYDYQKPESYLESSTVNSEDQFDKFGKHVACQLRELPLRNALILQEAIQSLITKERIACLPPDDEIK